MAVFRFYRAWRLERERVRIAVSLAENWRARGCLLRLNDTALFNVALLWVRTYVEAYALDGVEAGRAMRATVTADACIQAVLSHGGSMLVLDGTPLWAVRRVMGDGGAGCAAEIGGAAAGGK